MGKTERTDEEWRRSLTPQQYEVLRQRGTEPPFTGAYVECHDEGTYRCAACGTALFSSEAKFDSGSGWPSFVDVLDEGAVDLLPDSSHGMDRVEVVCRSCGGHLGHLFDDGPAPVGNRYCINSAALQLDGGATS
jgi:peptide-methionine (R)-S-oxide reductase